MYSPYYNDIQTIRSLNQRCPIANKIYTTLLSENFSYNPTPANHNKFSCSNIDKSKERLYASLSEIPYIPHEYFFAYYDHMFYEIIFEIYHYSKIQILPYQRMPSIKDCIDKLSPTGSTNESIQQEISRNKKNLLFDFNNLKTKCTYNQKLNTFYAQLGLWNNSLPKITPFMTPENTIIILRSYSDSIFNMKNSKDGLLLHTVYNIIDDYLYDLRNCTSFNKEYCFYEFNHMYHIIQYSRCASQYLDPERYTHKGIRTEYFPLYIYSKLFDTPYISLIDFICRQYDDQLSKIYENPLLLRAVMVTKELLNSFWIPIINLCLKDAVFTYNGGNFESICKTCKNWLDSQMASSAYTYTSLLNNAKKRIEHSTYPTPKDYNNRGDIKDQKYAKTGTPNHQFNIVLSKAFFYNDFPVYLSAYTNAPYTLDHCLAFIENCYKMQYQNTKDYTIQSCNEYVTSNYPPGIIAP